MNRTSNPSPKSDLTITLAAAAEVSNPTLSEHVQINIIRTIRERSWSDGGKPAVTLTLTLTPTPTLTLTFTLQTVPESSSCQNHI